MSVKRKPRSGAAASPEPDVWTLRLYIAGQTAKSLAAFANLKRICEERLHGRYKIEIVDLLQYPSLAKDDQILAIPTVVRRYPTPILKMIGDLSNVDRVLVAIDLLREPKLVNQETATLEAP